MNIEKFSNQNQSNKEQWSQVEETINKKEREKAKEKSSVKVEDYDLKNSALKGNMKRVLDRTTEKESPEEAEEKEDSLSKEAKELISLRWKNLIESFREYKNKEDDIILDEICLQKAIESIRKKDARAISTRNELTDGLVDEMNTLKRE